MTSRSNAGDDDNSSDARAAEPGQKRRRRRRHRNAAGDGSQNAAGDGSGNARADRPRSAADGSRNATAPRPRNAAADRQRNDARRAPSASQPSQPPSSRDRGAAKAPGRPAPSPQEAAPDRIAEPEHSEPFDDAFPGKSSPASESWGSDDELPASPFELVAEFPSEPPATDPDPVTFDLFDAPRASLDEDVASVVAVRFVPAGRVTWCNAGDIDFRPGDRVLVDSDRGPRLAWVATPPIRRPISERGIRRIIRRATDRDLGERADDAHHARALRTAKDAAAAIRLPLKVFRVELGGGKLVVYYTADERLDLREFARSVSQTMGLRIELRQLGGRDEAKLVGGIGSCGLPLCCTTWLPEFVPVSIKMAKDQGLVLSPSRVSGQCGRLKCCLVYEQEAYAELRKGLPKLGKRVVSARGEGRVVEVDVLTQRVRVSYAPGDTELLPAIEVTPRFPSGNPSGGSDQAARGETAHRDAPEAAHDDDPSLNDHSDEDLADTTDEST